MGFLKGLLQNRARPDASIVTRYSAQEASNFCAAFLEKAKEIGLSKSRHEGRLLGHGTINRREIIPPPERFSKAHRSVLQHLSEVNPYLGKHISYLKTLYPKENSHRIMQEHNREFAKWFQNEVHLASKDSSNNVSHTI